MFPDISNVASANECTGLMYKSPQNQAELESYQQLSSMLIPRPAAGAMQNRQGDAAQQNHKARHTGDKTH